MDYREANIIAQTFGFATGTALSALLLVLVYRPGGKNRGSRFLFAACIFIANSAGLFKNLALLVDPNLSLVLEHRIRSIGFAAGALVPCGILPVWRTNAIISFRRRAGSWLVLYAAVSGSLIAAAVIAEAWAPQRSVPGPDLHLLTSQDGIGNLAIYNGLVTLVLGGAVLLPGTLKGDRKSVV